jgi:hypothetical protein
LLLCHGVGNYGPGDYDAVKQALRAAVGEPTWATIAVYEVFYDEINDWFVRKDQARDLIGRALAFVKGKLGGDDVAEAAAEGACDVIWPVLSVAARDALRRAYIGQLVRMVVDGEQSGVAPRRQKVVIMGHSLGCFHTYEALWAIANDPQYNLLPSLGECPTFRSVVLVASPVQLIRRVAEELGDAIPDPGGLATTSNTGLAVPVDRTGGGSVAITKQLVSLTGTMDPVGGHLLGRKLAWAYMSLPDPNFVPRIQAQQILSGPGGADAAALFRELVSLRKPQLSVENPHSWERYVRTSAGEVRQWVLA